MEMKVFHCNCLRSYALRDTPPVKPSNTNLSCTYSYMSWVFSFFAEWAAIARNNKLMWCSFFLSLLLIICIFSFVCNGEFNTYELYVVVRMAWSVFAWYMIFVCYLSFIHDISIFQVFDFILFIYICFSVAVLYASVWLDSVRDMIMFNGSVCKQITLISKWPVLQILFQLMTSSLILLTPHIMWRYAIVSIAVIGPD